MCKGGMRTRADDPAHSWNHTVAAVRWQNSLRSDAQHRSAGIEAGNQNNRGCKRFSVRNLAAIASNFPWRLDNFSRRRQRRICSDRRKATRYAVYPGLLIDININGNYLAMVQSLTSVILRAPVPAIAFLCALFVSTDNSFSHGFARSEEHTSELH